MIVQDKALVRKISNWIKEQVREAGARGIVVGLSGGVDSSLVAVLSKKAVRENLLALIMPCKSCRGDLEDARYLAKRFKIKIKCINLEPVFKSFMKVLPNADKKTQGNLKARLRMVTLYYYANKLNYLVAGTGNKSELMVGYFTKYGDAGADILPIADLFKTQVRQLSRHLGIPDKIIAKPPSAGLWVNQTDEAELGITYRELDHILSQINNRVKQRAHIKINKIKGLIYKSEHKRQGPKILYLRTAS
jgi:NAD+ synthase